MRRPANGNWNDLRNVEPIEFASQELRNDKGIILALLKYNAESKAVDGKALRHAGPLPRGDKDVILEALKTSG